MDTLIESLLMKQGQGPPQEGATALAVAARWKTRRRVVYDYDAVKKSDSDDAYTYYII